MAKIINMQQETADKLMEQIHDFAISANEPAELRDLAEAYALVSGAAIRTGKTGGNVVM